MIDPNKMVLINIIGSLIILFGTLFYRFIFPKKKINFFKLLLFVSILPIISIFRAGTYESGDFNIHIYRSIEFYTSLSEGNLMPSWASNLNATYGYPLFIFNYSLPYYFISLFHFLGFSFISSLKIFLMSNILLSGIFMYIFIQNKFKKELASFISSIFYVFAPYHLISVHFKITIGEILAYTLIPLCFLFIDKFLQNNKKVFIILSGLTLGLIALSHIFIALVLIPIIFFYLFTKSKSVIKNINNSMIIFAIGALISIYQWLPPFIYKNHLLISNIPTDFSKLYFPHILDLLYSPWQFGLLFQGPKGEISNLIGYAQLIIVISILYLLLKNKVIIKYKNEITTWLAIMLTTVFMVLPQSIPIWNLFPMINAAGSHRLLLIIGFITAVLAGYFALTIKDKLLIYLIICLCIVLTILNWGQRRVIPNIADIDLQRNLPYSTYQGEHHYYAITKYVDSNNPWFSKIPIDRVNVLSGNTKIKTINNSTTKHQYEVESSTKSLIRENTLYFPGWKAFANKNLLKITPTKEGLLNIELPKGNYILTIKYEDVFILVLSKFISIASIFILTLYISVYFYKNRHLFPKF